MSEPHAPYAGEIGQLYPVVPANFPDFYRTVWHHNPRALTLNEIVFVRDPFGKKAKTYKPDNQVEFWRPRILEDGDPHGQTSNVNHAGTLMPCLVEVRFLRIDMEHGLLVMVGHDGLPRQVLKPLTIGRAKP